jgi:hypothetical protein
MKRLSTHIFSTRSAKIFLATIVACIAVRLFYTSGASLAAAPAVSSGPALRSSGDFTLSDADRAHWAFVPVKRSPPPSVALQSAEANPIDQFILAKLQAKALKFSAPANKTTLIRRVTFDLIGLPPTPAEVDAFLADTSPQAYEKLVDRLLASPRYGERWGRHWLDLARFAQTDGYEYDAIRPNAWRYRDYVIRSFNEDKPYDRFIREQIAGDELWPGDPDAVIATGFNLLGPDMVDSSDQIQRRHNTLNDMTDTCGLALLGLTIGCARCHDHKFDPISQRDYYGLQAFFTSVQFSKDKPIPTAAEQAAYDAAKRLRDQTPAVRELSEMEAAARETVRAKKLLKLSKEAQEAHNTPAEHRNAEQANLVLETDGMLAVSERELAEALTASDKAHRKELQEAIKSLGGLPPLPAAMAIADGKTQTKTFVLRRGEYSQPREEVVPAFPAVLLSPGSIPPASTRSDLASWLTSPANPLVARVMVNRIWQHHFGQGLVSTPSDFGTRGQPPTHPELLDYLAGEFIANGWSVKSLHRLMLLSRTYQQFTNAAARDDHAEEIDPENHLYWRMNRTRLEGEIIRDSLLAISGQLNEEPGGPGVHPPLPADVFKGATWDVSKDHKDWNRRSIYIFARRNLRFPFLDVFDAPDSNLSCPVRERSITATQSLTLLNSQDVMSAAKGTAGRLKDEAASDEERIVLAYRLALGRWPTPKEMNLAKEFLAQSPMSELCRVLFNLNEFVYVE